MGSIVLVWSSPTTSEKSKNFSRYQNRNRHDKNKVTGMDTVKSPKYQVALNSWIEKHVLLWLNGRFIKPILRDNIMSSVQESFIQSTVFPRAFDPATEIVKAAMSIVNQYKDTPIDVKQAYELYIYELNQ